MPTEGSGEVDVKADSVRAILRALSEANVEFIVAGGLAVNAHGVMRLTHDVDLVIRLARENIHRTFEALEAIDYRPSVPVTWKEFADDDTRGGWIENKHMRVLNFWSDEHRETPVDVFVTEPFPFEAEYERAIKRSLVGMDDVRFVSLRTLIEMKETAGRHKDLGDVEDLRLLLDE